MTPELKTDIFIRISLPIPSKTSMLVKGKE
jgi:hypothetical protein